MVVIKTMITLILCKYLAVPDPNLSSGHQQLENRRRRACDAHGVAAAPAHSISVCAERPRPVTVGFRTGAAPLPRGR